MKMIIKNLQVIESHGEVKLSVVLESDRLGKQELWFSTPVEYEGLLCKNRMDAFLVAMLFPAMQYGEDVHVYGEVSEKLFFNINKYVIPLLQAFSPSCKKIRVSAERVCTDSLKGKGVGSGFSGGVDSFCTIYDRFILENSSNYKINSLLFLNVGSHGDGSGSDRLDSARRKFVQRYGRLKAFADEVGLGFIPMDSNVHFFHPWGHQKTHTLTSVAGVLNFQGFFSKYYYSSAGLNYSEMLADGRKYKDMDVGIYCDPLLLPLLSTESLEFIADGLEYSRTEKLLHILPYEPVQRFLNVCVSDADSWKNCSICPKCCRTLMTLELSERLDDFCQVFDIDKYKKKARLKYFCKQVALASKDSYALGNVMLAKAKGVKLPGYVFSNFVYMLILLKGRLVRLIK